MKSDFWRYQLILTILFVFWSNFFVTGSFLDQLVFNFALFYPLGFLVGYRSNFENRRIAYFSAFLFNCSSYVLAIASGVPIQDWKIVIFDFVSVIFILEIGRIKGKHANHNQKE
jgi:hypothetical protein